MLTVALPLPRRWRIRDDISFENRDPFEVITQDPGRKQTGHAATNYNCVCWLLYHLSILPMCCRDVQLIARSDCCTSIADSSCIVTLSTRTDSTLHVPLPEPIKTRVRIP